MFITIAIVNSFVYRYIRIILFQEREAEKIAEEAAAMRDVKPELQPARSPDTWQGNNFYRHLNAIKGT